MAQRSSTHGENRGGRSFDSNGEVSRNNTRFSSPARVHCSRLYSIVSNDKHDWGIVARHRASAPILASASSRSRAPSRASAPSQSSATNAASSSTSSSPMQRISSPAALVTAGRPRVPDIVKAYNRKVRARAREEKKSESNASENPTKRRRIV